MARKVKKVKKAVEKAVIVEKVVSASKLSCKVVGLYEYLPKAQKVDRENAWNLAVSMIYSEYEVIDIVMKGGEPRFVVEV